MKQLNYIVGVIWWNDVYLTFCFLYLFECGEFGNIITPCCLTAFINVLCRTNSLILWVLLILNSGAEPKDFLAAKTNEENHFPYYLGRTFIHYGFKISFHFQWGLCHFFPPEWAFEYNPEPVKFCFKQNTTTTKKLEWTYNYIVPLENSNVLDFTVVCVLSLLSIYPKWSG